MSGIRRWDGLSALGSGYSRTWGDAPGWYGIGALPLVLHATSFLPPLTEQRRIVAKVDELMALVDALETQLATARTTAAAALLAAALAELTASANGATSYQPGATPQEGIAKHHEG